MPEKCVGFACTGLLAPQAAFSGQDRRRQKAEMITVSLDKDLTAFSTLISVMFIFRMHAQLSKAVR